MTDKPKADEKKAKLTLEQRVDRLEEALKLGDPTAAAKKVQGD